MLGSSNSSWTERERETERKIIEGSSLHLWIPSRILARVKWTLNKWYARQSGRSFFLWKRETGTVGRKERNVIGDDCTWSIEPTNEEPSARGNSEAPPFFIFFLISRPFTSYFETVSKVSRIHRDGERIFDGKVKGRVFRGRSERFSDFSFHAVQTKLHSAHSE